MEAILNFIQAHKTYFDAAHALTSVVNLVGWCAAAVILVSARRRIESLSFGPFTFKLKQEAVGAATIAARAWQATVPDQKIDVPRIRATVEKAFAPEVANILSVSRFCGSMITRLTICSLYALLES